MEIKIKYFNEDYPRLEKIEKGDRIDLRVDSIADWEMKGKSKMHDMARELKEQVEKDIYDKALNDTFKECALDYNKGDVITFGLGVAMELPDGYEAVVSPRSSTFNIWGLIQTNSIGVIDESYCGDDDEWLIQFIAMRDGTIERFDKIAQFRIQKKMEDVKLKEVKELGNKNRGGYGSTGRK